MTRFAPPTIYQCPACAGYFKRYALGSLHFYDDVPEWSDGMSGQWWAGVGAPVGRCPACCNVVWVDDAIAVMQAPLEPRKIGPMARLWHRMTGDKRGRLRAVREWAALPIEIKQAESIDRLECADDLMEALTAPPTDDADDREVYLRRRLWWASSDHQRERVDGLLVTSSTTVAAAPALANRLRLLELVERDPKAQVERGELLRQLGRFDEAVAVLKAVEPDGYSEVKALKIERLARAGIAELRDFNAAVPRPSSVSQRRYVGECGDDYIVPSFLLPESRRVSGMEQSGQSNDTPNWRIRYTLPDHARTLRSRCMQAIVDRLHRRGH